MEGARVTSVISNRCIRTRLLVFFFFNLAITVCVMRSTTYRLLCVCLCPGSAVGDFSASPLASLASCQHLLCQLNVTLGEIQIRYGLSGDQKLFCVYWEQNHDSLGPSMKTQVHHLWKMKSTDSPTSYLHNLPGHPNEQVSHLHVPPSGQETVAPTVANRCVRLNDTTSYQLLLMFGELSLDSVSSQSIHAQTIYLQLPWSRL